MQEPRRTARTTADAPWRQRFAAAPILCHTIRRYAGGCLVARAHRALQIASEAEVSNAAASDLGIVPPVIRAAGTKGKAGEASALAFVRLAIERGFSLDVPAPGFAAWEQQSPALVVAAGYGYRQVCEELLNAGASPLVCELPDLDNAIHAALEHEQTVALLLAYSPQTRGLASSPNRYGKTPFVAALVAEPFKPAHRKALALMQPHVLLSDDDHRIVRSQRRLNRLQALISDTRVVPPRPVAAATTRFWQP